MLIKCRVFVLVCGEKDHHAAEPDFSAKDVPLMSVIIFFLLMKEGEIYALFLTILTTLLILSYMILFGESC